MKKIISIMAVFALALALGGCGSSDSNDKEKKDTTSEKDSGSDKKGFDLSKSYIEADGEKLYLPCTLDELLAFGFTIEDMGNEEIASVDTELQNVIGEISGIKLAFSDGSKYQVIIESPHFNDKVRVGDFTVNEFSDPDTDDQTMGIDPKDTLGETTLLINGVARTDEYKDALAPFEGNGYTKGKYQEKTVSNYEMDGKGDKDIEMNGYEVKYINMYIRGFEVDGKSLLYRSVSYYGADLIEE